MCGFIIHVYIVWCINQHWPTQVSSKEHAALHHALYGSEGMPLPPPERVLKAPIPGGSENPNQYNIYVCVCIVYIWFGPPKKDTPQKNKYVFYFLRGQIY